MKKLLLLVFVFFLSGSVFAQNTDKDDTYYNTQQYLQKVFEKTVEALRMKLLNSQVDSLRSVKVTNLSAGPASLLNGTKSVTTTASALAASTPAKYVVLTNVSGSTIYYGGSNVTTSNGRVLNNNMEAIVEIDDASKVYVVSPSGTVTIRYMIFN